MNNTDEKDALSPSQQQQEVWERILHHNDMKRENSTSTSSKSGTGTSHEEWPAYKTILDDIVNTDYTHVLECPHDILSNNKSSENKLSSQKKTLSFSSGKEKNIRKAFCAHGVVACAKIEMFSNPTSGTNHKNAQHGNADISLSHDHPYTGLLSPNRTISHCIIRLSSAMKPPAYETNMFGRYFVKATGGKLKDAKLFPMVALKAFRGQGVRSGNLLFAGPKIGQKSNELIKHCLCSQMTERVPSLLQPFIKKFYNYSDHPLSLGVSDFCSFDEKGDAIPSDEVQFPYVVVLKPAEKSTSSQSPSKKKNNEAEGKEDKFDSFIDDLLQVPSGSTLFDIFACPDPTSSFDASKIQRIGRIMTTSEIIKSSPEDGLFFRHQKKEEDFELRPHWRKEVNTDCTSKCGKAKGTIGRLVGSTFLESCINEKKYIDFEDC